MIQYNNIQNRAPKNYVFYRMFSTLIGLFVITAILYFIFGHGPINATVNGKPTVVDLEGLNRLLVIYGIPLGLFILSVINDLIYYFTFSFVLTADAISITSGLFFVSTKSVDYKDIQNVSTSYGPIMSLFGLGKLSGFTSSPGQLVINTDSRGSRSTSYSPDISMTLAKEDVEELRVFMSKADNVEKVQIVSSI